MLGLVLGYAFRVYGLETTVSGSGFSGWATAGVVMGRAWSGADTEPKSYNTVSGHVCVCLSIYIYYTYIYICMCVRRERERVRERERDRETEVVASVIR